MLTGWVIIPVALAYIGALFAMAYYADQRADSGRSLIANPYIYALSLGVYATAWTFYGSVGRAAADGVGFLPIYLGSDADDRAVVDGDAQDHPHQQGQPDHLARRLRRLALRQERAARRPGDRHRGRRHHSVHLAAVEGGLQQLHDPGPLPGDRDAGARGGGADRRRHGVLGGAAPGRVHHPLRHAPSRRLRAPRGHGRGDRLRVARQAGRLPRRRHLRHLRHLRRLRRHLRAGRRERAARAAARAARR